MKKILAMIMALTMILTLAVPTFATTITSVTENNTATANVSVVIANSSGTAVTTAATVYSIDITFAADLQFEWKATNLSGQQLVWDPTSHTYKNESGESAEAITWETPAAISDAVKVTNHSNAAVAVTASFDDSAKAVTVNGVTTTLSSDDKTLASAAVGESYGNTEKAPTVSYTLTPTGEPANLDQISIAMGTITVTITAPSAG